MTKYIFSDIIDLEDKLREFIADYQFILMIGLVFGHSYNRLRCKAKFGIQYYLGSLIYISLFCLPLSVYCYLVYFPLDLIVDGIVSMEGEGPLAGCAIFTNFIITSDCALSADLVCAKIMDYEWENIPYLKYILKQGISREIRFKKRINEQ